MEHPVVDVVVEDAHVQLRILVLGVNLNEVAHGVQHATPLVIRQPPHLLGLGGDLLAGVRVDLRLRVLLRGNNKPGHHKGAVPGEGDLAIGGVIQGKEAVAEDGEIKGPAGVLNGARGEVGGGFHHLGARAPGQLLVDAPDIAVHQLVKSGLLGLVAVGIHVGDVVGLDIHAPLLLLRSHRSGEKGHIHCLTPLCSFRPGDPSAPGTVP